MVELPMPWSEKRTGMIPNWEKSIMHPLKIFVLTQVAHPCLSGLLEGVMKFMALMRSQTAVFLPGDRRSL